MAGAQKAYHALPDPQEELGITHVRLQQSVDILVGSHAQECDSWQHCALCRSTRLGTETLRRARERRVVWRESNTPVHSPVRV